MIINVETNNSKYTGPKRGRKLSKVKTEAGSQEESKDISSNAGDLSTNLPQTKRKRRRGKNSDSIDTIISTSSSSSSMVY